MEAGQIAIKFVCVILSLEPRDVIALFFPAMFPTHGETIAVDVLFARRLAKSEECLTVSKSQCHDRLGPLLGGEVVEQRQMKARGSAGIKLRLKTKQTW